MHTAAVTMQTMTDPTGGDWDWAEQVGARELVEGLLLAFFAKCPDGARFGERCHAETGTHISDWAGVILTPDTPVTRAGLEAAGYQPRETEFVDADIHYAFSQPSAPLPDILLTESDRMSLGLCVESVAQFFAANSLGGMMGVQGEPLARARWARAFEGDTAALWVFERHGYDGYNLAPEPAESRIAALHHAERFRARARGPVCADGLDAEFDEMGSALRAAVEELGQNWAADVFLAAETEQFVARHGSAREQACRQRSVGLGLANTDHLVYASSRAGFSRTIELFASLGFLARESFAVPGGDIARILQHPVNGDVVAIVAPPGDCPTHASSFVALFGESVLGSGPVGMGLRADPDTLAVQIGLGEPGPCKVSKQDVDGDAIDAAAEAGNLDETFAHSLRTGGRVGAVLSAVSRQNASRRLTPASLAWRTPGV